MGITEARLRKSYDHAFTQMRVDELLKKKGAKQQAPILHSAGIGRFDLIGLVGKKKEPSPLPLEMVPVSYTHLRAHETREESGCTRVV